MLKLVVVVYHEGSPLGEAEIYPQNQKFDAMDVCKKEIRITNFSPPSERCPPLAVLHTIASSGVCFKMESKPPQAHESPLFSLYSTCLRDNKTAIMQHGEEELHLVAMPPRNKLEPFPCFWGFSVSPGLYGACLSMLNLRCLGIVFDLDETLIVANTMRSFEDRIEALQRKISTELDSQRIAGMIAEVKRYQDDKSILKQYVDNDQVIENRKVVKVQSEIVPPMSDSHQSLIRPIIKLHDRNIILTRINPLVRDTSVLVRLRPAWDELRSYLTAKGRKRFEVYVCTMAERDYALEMWRLLDPESNLISSKELLDRIVCVKSEVHHGFGRRPSSTRDLHLESCRNSSHDPTSPLLALQEIAMKTGEKLDFKSLLNAGTDLQFSFEVWFVGQKIGEGTGRTRRNAQLQAAEESLLNLANRYISSVSLELRSLPGDLNKISHRNENGFMNDPGSFGYIGSSRQDMPIASTSDNSRFSDQRSAGSQRPCAVSSLKELCMMEGLNLVFQEQPSLSVNSGSNGQVYAQVEVSGQVVGKGIGSNWEEAKQQAAQEALETLKSPPFSQRNQRRLSSPSPRSSLINPVKRMKPDFARGFSRAPSTRYSKNGPPVS